MSETDQSLKRRRRRRHWHAGFWMLMAVLFACGFVVLASMSLTGRVVVLPAWLSERVTLRMNQGISNGSVTLGRIEFGMTPRGRPRFRLVNLGVRDQSGLEVVQLYAVESGLKPLPLFRGRVELSTIYLSGAQVTIRRQRDGEFDLSFGQSGGTSGDLASVLDAIDRVFTTGPLAKVDGIKADALTITLEDARSGRLWQVTDGNLQLTQTDTVVDITVAFEVFNQTEELAETVLGFRSAKGSSQASFAATFKNAAAADIAAQSPVLSFLGVVDAPISGSLRTDIDDSGRISDLAGTLELGNGALSPAPGARPVRFDRAKVYIDYDPTRNRLEFPEISVTSELGNVRGEGHAYLRDYHNGLPGVLLGQMRLNRVEVSSPDLFAAPIVIERGMADFRLRLDPFTIELGQAVLHYDGNRFTASGEVGAGRDGWRLALDAASDRVSREQVLALWPLTAVPKSRDWTAGNVLAGEALNARAAFRLDPGKEPRISVGAVIRDARVRAVPELEPLENGAGYLSIEDKRFTVVAEHGDLPTPSGEMLDASGTVFIVPHMHPEPVPAHVDLAAEGSLTAILSLLDGAPFNIFEHSDLGPDLATGRARVRGKMDMNMFLGMTVDDVDYDISAEATGVRSQALIPDRILTAERAQVRATSEAVEVTADGHIGKLAAGGTWRQLMGDANRGHSRLEGWVELSPVALEELNINLAEGGITGRGEGRLVVDFHPDAPPDFTLVSDLNRVGLALPDLAFDKARNQTGRLEVEGTLGTPPDISRVDLEVPGLKAHGSVSVTAAGGLQEARFDRVQMGAWLDAPISIRPTGEADVVEIAITGGRADLSRADFSAGGTDPGGGARGPALPVTVALDELTVSRGVKLTSFSGNFDRRGGFNGTFTALVADGPPVSGVVAPQPDGLAIRITSSDAGGVLNRAGVFRSAQGGDLTLILAPRAGEGVYDGELAITNTRMQDAPALAELLSAISVVGILEQLDGKGLSFLEVDARFRITPDTVTVYSASAIGPSLGLSLDGHYDLTTSTMDLQGVLSPFYLVNAIGQVLTRKGEGLIGFNFTLKGPYTDPKTSVNPLSILTPGMFREIFRRPPPEIVD